MDAGNNSAIISATAGISGVLLGGAITALKEWLTHRSRRKTETAYLAAIVVSHLDRFANGCLHVALDDAQRMDSLRAITENMNQRLRRPISSR